jgi:hypothetical protein
MTLLESLKGTYAVIGQDISDIGLEVLAQDLAAYPLEHVQAALTRCRKELKRIALSDVLDRMPGQHPGPEEAWAIVAPSLGNELVTLVWTSEIRQAWGMAQALSDDMVGARMAFKEHYLRLIGEARALGDKPQWSVSLGTDQQGREVAIMEGVKQGKLTMEYAHKLLPVPTDPQAIAFLRSNFPRLLE